MLVQLNLTLSSSSLKVNVDILKMEHVAEVVDATSTEDFLVLCVLYFFLYIQCSYSVSFVVSMKDLKIYFNVFERYLTHVSIIFI